MPFDLRASAFAALAVLGVQAAGGGESLDLTVAEPSMSAAGELAVIPAELRPRINLDAVWWMSPRDESLVRLSERWGMHPDLLRSLNPHLGKRVEGGQRLVVYRRKAGEISRSVGAPNRGRLENGVPFPEGRYWALRDYRPRSYATRNVVANLALVFDQWGRDFPDARPVRIGEFSRRSGGKASPHSSHRSGRDVDIGYVLSTPEKTKHRFTKADLGNLDASATWALVRGMILYGGVDRVFMDADVQRLLLPFATRELSADALPRYFSVMADGPRAAKKAYLVHWRGHDDHMHVRFKCSDADVACAENPRPRKKKKRRRKRKRRRRASRT